MNVEFNGAITWLNTSGHFLVRPSVIGVDNSVSGIGLRAENIHTVHASQQSAGALSIMPLEYDLMETILAGLQVGVPIHQDAKLHPKFTVSALHVNGSLPSEWICRLIKNGSHAASGWFRWDPTNVVPRNSCLTWLTNGEQSNIEFSPADYVQLVVDNNGSGTVVTTPGIRVAFSFMIDPGL